MIRAFILITLVFFSFSEQLHALSPKPIPKSDLKCEVKQLNINDITPKLVATSEYIVAGKLISPTPLINKLISTKKHKYVNSSLVHTKPLKGKIDQPKITISKFSREYKHGLCIKKLLVAHTKKIIAFLVKPESHNEEGKYYFTALAIYSSEKEKHIKELIEKQKVTLNQFNKKEIEKTISDKKLHKKVKALIDRTVISQYQQQSFDELYNLGKPAVPSIILLMEDYRPLPNRHTNSPQMHFYGPKVVLDGLSTILTFITGESGGSIYNGGSARERKQSLDLWRLYLSNLKTIKK